MNLSMRLYVFLILQYLFNLLVNFNQISEFLLANFNQIAQVSEILHFYKFYKNEQPKRGELITASTWKKVPVRIQSLLNIRKSIQGKAKGDKN